MMSRSSSGSEMLPSSDVCVLMDYLRLGSPTTDVVREQGRTNVEKSDRQSEN